MTEERIYQNISEEFANGEVDAALWTKATALAEGHPEKTKAAYIRLRFTVLKKSAAADHGRPLATLASRGANDSDNKQLSRDEELFDIRRELARKLATQKKANLYSLLCLQPDASDAVIQAAIAAYESHAHGTPSFSVAEFKYAKETLSNPALRDQYDRKLLASLSDDVSQSGGTYAYESAYGEPSWWESRKTSVIIGVFSVVLFGYLGLGFFKERHSHEIKKEAVDVQHETVDMQRETAQGVAAVENDRLKAEAEARQRALSIAEEAQRRQMDYQAQMQERQRLEQERRNAMEMERQRLMQQQAENARAQRERQYWTCMNQQLSVVNLSSADASARCAIYRR